jgi:hypothetical protein
MLQGLSQVLLFVIVLGFLIKLGLQGRYFSELPRNVLDDVSEKAQLKEMLANKDVSIKYFMIYLIFISFFSKLCQKPSSATLGILMALNLSSHLLSTTFSSYNSKAQ